MKLTLPQLHAMARAAGLDLGTTDSALQAELENVRTAGLDAVNKLADAWKERDRYQQACHEFNAERETMRQELSSIKAERDALQRTVEKLRERAAVPMLANHAPAPKLDDLNSACDRCGRHVGEGKLFHDEATESAVCEHCVTGAPTQRPAAPLISISIRFDGPQGFGTADRIKAIGGRWVRTSKRGETMKGYWSLPNDRAASDLIAALTAEGRAIALL